MKRLLPLICALVVSVGCSACATNGFLSAPKPLTPQEKVTQSLVRITGELPGRETPAFSCSGFSVDRAAKLYLTAAHCVPESIEGQSYQLRLNRAPVDVISLDRFRDIALLRGSFGREGVEFRDHPLERFEEVFAMGFGHGFTMPWATRHTLQRVHFNLGEEDVYPGNMYLNPVEGGMSGGPVCDLNGKVVGMVQRGNHIIMYGVDYVTLQEFLEEF